MQEEEAGVVSSDGPMPRGMKVTSWYVDLWHFPDIHVSVLLCVFHVFIIRSPQLSTNIRYVVYDTTTIPTVTRTTSNTFNTRPIRVFCRSYLYVFKCMSGG